MDKERLYYVDWLRVSVILSLVPYHAALTYSGLGDVYIKTPLKDLRILPFLIITSPLDNFFMTLLFFVSGIAAYYIFKHKSGKEFIREREKKILIPFALGTILLCPLQAYFKGLNEGFTGGYFRFLSEFFSSKIVDYLGYAHLWFLLYLFVFSLICLPLFTKWQKDKNRLLNITSFICKKNNIFIPIGFIILAETLLRPFYPGKQILVMDWANDIIYLSVFIFGFAFASDTKIQERLSDFINISKVLVIVCIVTFIYIDIQWTVYSSNAAYLSLMWAFIKGIYECSAIILLIGLGRKYFNKKSQTLSYLSKASFSLYIIHFLPVSAFTYFTTRAGFNVNVYLKYLLVIVSSYIFMFAVYEFIIKRFSGKLNKAKMKT